MRLLRIAMALLVFYVWFLGARWSVLDSSGLRIACALSGLVAMFAVYELPVWLAKTSPHSATRRTVATYAAIVAVVAVFAPFSIWGCHYGGRRPPKEHCHVLWNIGHFH